MDDSRSDLDDEFPLGDGTADDSANVVCPYCGESVTIAVDAGGGGFQQYVEDCEVCCNPWHITLSFVNGAAEVTISRLND